MRGIEPLTFSLPRKRSTPELHRLVNDTGLFSNYSSMCLKIKKKPRLSGRRDSNPRPSAWKADALPTELLPQ
jgi:hypothetical protein